MLESPIRGHLDTGMNCSRVGSYPLSYLRKRFLHVGFNVDKEDITVFVKDMRAAFIQALQSSMKFLTLAMRRTALGVLMDGGVTSFPQFEPATPQQVQHLISELRASGNAFSTLRSLDREVIILNECPITTEIATKEVVPTDRVLGTKQGRIRCVRNACLRDCVSTLAKGAKTRQDNGAKERINACRDKEFLHLDGQSLEPFRAAKMRAPKKMRVVFFHGRTMRTVREHRGRVSVDPLVGGKNVMKEFHKVGLVVPVADETPLKRRTVDGLEGLVRPTKPLLKILLVSRKMGTLNHVALHCTCHSTATVEI